MKSYPVFVKIISTGEVLRYKSQREAAVQLGLSASMVIRTCQNENQPCLQTKKGLVIIVNEGNSFRELTSTEKETQNNFRKEIKMQKDKNFIGNNWYYNDKDELLININNIAFIRRKDINEYKVEMIGTERNLIIDHRTYQEIINLIKEKEGVV